MKNITKKALYALLLPLLTANFAIIGMKRASHPMTDSAMAQPNKKRKIEAIMESPYKHSSHKEVLRGTIELDDDVTVGFGNNACIAALNKAGIPAQHNWPLVPIKILIPNSKKNPQDAQTFTDWTEDTLPIIQENINNTVHRQLRQEMENLSPLLGGVDLTPENRQSWIDWQTRNECMLNSAQRKIEQLRYPVPLIPVHYLSSSSNTKLNLFGCCNVQLTFDQHQKLDGQVKQFHETPGMFSRLNGGAESILREIEKIQALPQAETELERNRRRETLESFNNRLSKIGNKQMYETEEELQEKNLIKKHRSRERTGILDTIGYNLLYHTNSSYKPGNNSPDMSRLVLEHNLKKEKNPFYVVRDRQIGVANRLF